MSRGPGRIERAIDDAFNANSSRTFTVEELAALVYPGLNRIEKKHRVAIIRAAEKVTARLHWQMARSERPGGHNVYFNLLDVRSYSLSRLRADFSWYREPVDELERMLDDPDHPHSRHAHVRPGGAWWKHVEINREAAFGDPEKAKAMSEAHNSGLRAGFGIR